MSTRARDPLSSNPHAPVAQSLTPFYSSPVDVLQAPVHRAWKCPLASRKRGRLTPVGILSGGIQGTIVSRKHPALALAVLFFTFEAAVADSTRIDHATNGSDIASFESLNGVSYSNHFAHPLMDWDAGQLSLKATENKSSQKLLKPPEEIKIHLVDLNGS